MTTELSKKIIGDENQTSSGESSGSLKTSELKAESWYAESPTMQQVRRSGDGEVIATVYGHGEDAAADAEIRRSRARLIAAAPALYEAAQLASHQLAVMLTLRPERDGGLYRQALDACDAALALANCPHLHQRILK